MDNSACEKNPSERVYEYIYVPYKEFYLYRIREDEILYRCERYKKNPLEIKDRVLEKLTSNPHRISRKIFNKLAIRADSFYEIADILMDTFNDGKTWRRLVSMVAETPLSSFSTPFIKSIIFKHYRKLSEGKI